jgi:SAM-dependent methyltransferase
MLPRLFLRPYRMLRNTIRGLQPSKYCIRGGYSHRHEYRYFDDRIIDNEWQREVYQYARSLMQREHLKRVIDVGCGSALKLIRELGEFDTIGIDVSPTYEWLKERYPDRSWVRSFTDEANSLRGDLVICADVIEHVLDPDSLIKFIKSIRPKFVILSTPERDLTYGGHHWGPPTNETHIREWNFEEFDRYIGIHFDIADHSISNREQFTQMIVCTPK